MSLDALRLSALDIIAMTPEGDTDADSLDLSGGPLEARLLSHATRVRPAGVPADAVASIDLERDPAWSADVITLPDLLSLARTVRELLEGARALEPRDLTSPGDSDPDATSIDTSDLASRAGRAVAALQSAIATLTTAMANGDP